MLNHRLLMKSWCNVVLVLMVCISCQIFIYNPLLLDLHFVSLLTQIIIQVLILVVHLVLKLCHARLGHCNPHVLKMVMQHCNIPISKKTQEFSFACCVWNSNRLPSSLSNTVYTHPFELVSHDFSGTSNICTPSTNGYPYHVTFADAY
ncbi:hypothetical protein V8G54_015302 [Vigna mungo]|uniref:Uncharacterized protein n=1 Tax=Vigna mungo TaxID=3915 RepID=A0AAQ3RYA7_VIGMU